MIVSNYSLTGLITFEIYGTEYVLLLIMARYYLNIKNKDALFVSKSQQYQERFGESRNGRKTNKDLRYEIIVFKGRDK